MSPVPSGKLGWASSSSLQVAAGLSLVPSGCSTSALSSRLRASSRARATVRFRRSEGWRRCWKSRGQSPAPVGPPCILARSTAKCWGRCGGDKERAWLGTGGIDPSACSALCAQGREALSLSLCPQQAAATRGRSPPAPRSPTHPQLLLGQRQRGAAGAGGAGETLGDSDSGDTASPCHPRSSSACTSTARPRGTSHTTSGPRGTSVALLTGGPVLPLGPGWPGEPFSPCPRMRRKRKERRGAELLPHVPTVGTGLSRSPRMRTRGDRAPQQGSPRARCPRTHFLSRQALEEKSKGVPQGEAAGPADPMCWGGKGLTGFPGSPGSPRGPGGPASPCRGTRGRHTWPRWGISQPCSLISSPFPRLLFAGVFCTKGEESTPNTNPCPVPPHPAGTCGPLGPGLPGTPWGPCLP